jgi:molecular chaperone DnaK
VFDLGGGTFDVSVLEIGDGVFEVKATHGDTSSAATTGTSGHRLAGRQFKGDHGVDLSKDNMAMQRLKEAAEKAKIELSQVQQTQINLPFITATARRPAAPRRDAHPGEVPGAHGRPARALPVPFEQAIKDAGLSKGEIDHVILVGGSTRMPAVQDLVQS